MLNQTETSNRSPNTTSAESLCYLVGSLCLAVGIITVFAWFLGLTRVVQWATDSSPLHFNSAVMITFFGATIVFLTRRRQTLALCTCLPAFLIAVVTLYEMLSGHDLGIDEVFVHDYLTNPSLSPGRLSPNSAFCGILITTSVMLIIFSHLNTYLLVLATIFSSLCFAFGLTAMLGYLSGISGAYAWFTFTHMPVQSALLFALLGKSCTLLAWQLLRSPENRKKTSILKTIAWPLSLSIFSTTIALSFSIYVEEAGVSPNSFLPLVCFAFGGVMAVLAGAMSFLWVESQTRTHQLEVAHNSLIMEIEQREKAECQLRAAKESAQQANEAKSRFLAAVSHEIRSPIGTIIGFANLLKQPDLATSERERYCEIISRNSQTLLQFVDELLDRQRVESGNIQIDVEPVKVRTILKEVEELFELNERKKSLSYKITVGDDVPNVITTDPKRLRQVLLNLVSNALKYTDRGHIYLNVIWSKQTSGAKLAFHVQDTGIGISDEFKDRIFQPFQRDSAVKPSKISGTGLGLDISRKIARRLGGDVELVASAAGTGSTFCFWLNVS